MTTVQPTATTDIEDPLVAAAQAGDEGAFAALVERHRRELHVHCYRMLGSFEEAEDLVQETFLRAWRRRETYEGRATFRAWLYRIATNACLDAIARRPRLRRADASQNAGAGPRVGSGAPGTGGTPSPTTEVAWLQPYPDRLLDELAAPEDGPDAVVVSRETIELAFLAALQHLPPAQRAVLVLRDVLGWPAGETAALLDRSVASVNSALQRARGTLRSTLPARRGEWAPDEPSEPDRAVLERFMAATEAGDIDALAALMRHDVLHAMPPEPHWYGGRDTIIAEWGPALTGPEAWGEWRVLPTWANRQPAMANYLRRPGEDVHAAIALDVLRVEDGLIVEVITFPPDVFPAFDLPSHL